MGETKQPKLQAGADLLGLSGIPDGFGYVPNVITTDQERLLIRKFEALPLKPFEFRGFLGNRRTVSYGFHYDHGKQAVAHRGELPDFLIFLRRIASTLSGFPAEYFRQAMVTEYAPGAGIGWHRDKSMFGEVVAISFNSDCALRFRRPEGAGWLRHSTCVARRSGYLLRGEARSLWEHSIAPAKSLRYSVTFRTLREEN